MGVVERGKQTQGVGCAEPATVVNSIVNLSKTQRGVTIQYNTNTERLTTKLHFRRSPHSHSVQHGRDGERDASARTHKDNTSSNKTSKAAAHRWLTPDSYDILYNMLYNMLRRSVIAQLPAIAIDSHTHQKKCDEGGNQEG